MNQNLASQHLSIATNAIQLNQVRVQVTFQVPMPSYYPLIPCKEPSASQVIDNPSPWRRAEKRGVSEVAKQHLHHFSGTEPNGQCSCKDTDKETK